MKKKLLAVFCLFITSGCSVFGIMDIEHASYKVMVDEEKFQVRQYDDLIIAQTTVNEQTFKKDGEVAFKRLAGYIFGNNKSKQEIAMTAPVFMGEQQNEEIKMTAPVFLENSKDGRVMAFVLPAKYTLETLPEPNDENILIKKQIGKKVATIQFNGLFREKNLLKNKIKLEKWIQEKGLKPTSEAVFAGYNPPWTIPMFRRNEVQIQIE